MFSSAQSSHKRAGVICCWDTGPSVKSGFVYLRPLHVALVRAKGPYAQSAAQAWAQMFEWLKRSGTIRSVGTGYGLLLDDPRVTDAERCRYEACVEITPEMVGLIPADFGTSRLPGGAFARTRHVGGAAGLGISISKVRKEGLPNQGLTLDPKRPIIEIYLDNPDLVAPEQQRVDICIPISVVQSWHAAA